jgi:RND family efflux transporter MFP subunit
MSPWNRLNKTIRGANRVVACVIVLMVGFIAMLSLSSMKKPPAEVTYEEQAVDVEAVRVAAQTIPVTITGYGEAKTLNMVSIVPEVSGRVVEIHPRLETGEVIDEGDLLFKIDPRDYEAAVREAEASVNQLESTIERIKQQQEIDQQRLKTLERNRELARKEYERSRRLLEEDNVGTRAGVEKAEQAYNSAVDMAAQLARAVELYPTQIQESQSGLESAKARLELARTRLDRCIVEAPFTGRLEEVKLEKDQYVTPGLPALTLADDSLLEIQVPLDSREAQKWLRFKPRDGNNGDAWFSRPLPVKCTVRWTEDPGGHTWRGTLHRVVRFDRQTRTLTVAVRVEGEDALSSDSDDLPLVDGMFCSVEIPGRDLENVFRLPRWAVSFENTTYRVTEESRLETVDVEVARTQGNSVIVSKGLQPGDVVVTTRLVDPLEGTLLNYTLQSGAVATATAEDKS